MKVFIALRDPCGCDENYYYGVFSTREKAEECLKNDFPYLKMNLDNIEELILEEEVK